MTPGGWAGKGRELARYEVSRLVTVNDGEAAGVRAHQDQRVSAGCAEAGGPTVREPGSPLGVAREQLRALRVRRSLGTWCTGGPSKVCRARHGTPVDEVVRVCPCSRPGMAVGRGRPRDISRARRARLDPVGRFLTRHAHPT